MPILCCFLKHQIQQLKSCLIPADDDPYDVPFIVSHPKSAVAMVGQNITLRCDAVYTPNPDHEYYFLNWLKDGQVRNGLFQFNL